MSPPESNFLDRFVHADPARMGGVLVFRNTRVPVKALFDYLRAGRSANDFVSDFEGVATEAVYAVLAAAEADIIKQIPAA